MKPKVPPETDKQRESQAARNLGVGDWLAAASTGGKESAQVLSTFWYEEDAGDELLAGELLAVVYRYRSGGEPAVVSFRADDQVGLATADEIRSSPYVAYADELHRIADDLAKLTDVGAPPLFAIDIHPGPRAGRTDAKVRARVDAVGLALLGKPGEDRAMASGSYHYGVRGQRGAIEINVYDAVDEPLEDPMASGREVDNGDASTPVPAGVDGAAMTGRGADGGCE